jgi:hypothetical protein
MQKLRLPLDEGQCRYEASCRQRVYPAICQGLAVVGRPLLLSCDRSCGKDDRACAKAQRHALLDFCVSPEGVDFSKRADFMAGKCQTSGANC